MSIINAYWIPPAWQQYEVAEINPKKNDLGFRNDIPHRLPTTIGSQYYNEGRNELPLPKIIEFNPQGEYYAPDNVIPATGGVPLINISDKIYKFERKRLRFRE